jgi:BCD family chlorophyll transporter-like MFS transporter
MKRINNAMAGLWSKVGPEYLPFADAATDELPLARLLRLALFQVSVGMAVVLLTGTLNRVMILELNVPTWLVSFMVALPLVFAPMRVLIGHRSDTHKSLLGWRRVPYIWMGSLMQFCGLAMMPFALLVLSGDTRGPEIIPGQVAAAMAFLLVGFGLHTTQTAGLALANDLAPERVRPRVVALLYVMLLLGMVGSSIILGSLLADFSNMRLIQVIQGTAAVTMILNVIALWKQEVRNPAQTDPAKPRVKFRDAWARFSHGGRTSRLLVAIGLGTAAFSMQDVLLEPYGGEILKLSVGQTTLLTALLAGGALAGFAYAARTLGNGADACRLAAIGALFGLPAFAAVTFAAPIGSTELFRFGTLLIGFGGGLFAVGGLTAAMALAKNGDSGIALGAWGAVQATAMGTALALGGIIRDVVTSLAMSGTFGPTLVDPLTGYGVVYVLEIVLLFATLIAIGPLVGTTVGARSGSEKFGLAEFPG